MNIVLCSLGLLIVSKVSGQTSDLQDNEDRDNED